MRLLDPAHFHLLQRLKREKDFSFFAFDMVMDIDISRNEIDASPSRYAAANKINVQKIMMRTAASANASLNC